MEMIAAIAALVGLSGALGFSHQSLRKRMTDMEIELYKRPTFGDSRRLISDKIEPVTVETKSIVRRIDELKAENQSMNEKIDRLLVLCTKLAHED